MLRAIIGVIAIIAAVLWTPVWFQLLLIVLALIFLPFRLLFLVPALISDLVYSPSNFFDLKNFKMTAIVAVLLLVWFILITYTNLSNRYVSKKK